MKFHFQIISTDGEELNPVINGEDIYKALETLISYCYNNMIVPERIILVQYERVVEDEPCTIYDEPINYWHKF